MTLLRPHLKEILLRRTPQPAAGRREHIVLAMNGVLLLLGVVAVGSLVAHYGFFLTPSEEAAVARATELVLYGFVAQGLVKFLAAYDRRTLLRRAWAEYAVLTLVLLRVLLPQQIETVVRVFSPLIDPPMLAQVYIVVTQVVVVMAFIPPAIRASERLMTASVQPSTLILLGFLVLILVGTGLLSLPRATVSGGIPLVDALFTATSAACVTGLTVLDTSGAFTPLGRGIILALIQAGGLGIMTLTSFFALMLPGSRPLKESTSLQSLLGTESLGRVRDTLVSILILTLLLESLGAVLLYLSVSGSLFGGTMDHWWFSVFHSVSAFCNAGFSLVPDGFAVPQLRGNTAFLSIVMALIILGGLGFPVLNNIIGVLARRRRNGFRTRLSVHSRIVLVASAALLIGGALGIGLIEGLRPASDRQGGDLVLHALFQSVTARTAGFNTWLIGDLAPATLFLMMLLMWIGASPASTGGGIKTTTFAVMVLSIRSAVSGRRRIDAFRRRVPETAVLRAMSTVILSMALIGTGLLVLLLTENAGFTDLLFEVISAISTVGLSTGITPGLTDAGKSVIVALMLAGRVGVLGVMLALVRERREGNFDYADASVLIT